MSEWPRIRVDQGGVEILGVYCFHRSEGCVIYEIAVGEKNPRFVTGYVFEDGMCHTGICFSHDGGPTSRVIFSFPESEEWEDISDGYCWYSMRVAFYRNDKAINEYVWLPSGGAA